MSNPPFYSTTPFAGTSFDNTMFGEIVIQGVPYDIGVSNRPGSRFGPEAIRRASYMFCDETDDYWKIVPSDHGEDYVVDMGDISEISTPEDMLVGVQEATKNELDLNRTVITLGGDHSITLPILRAMKAHYGKIQVIHFDAHCDTWEETFGIPFGHGSFVYHALKEDLISDIVQIGLRAAANSTASNYMIDHRYVLNANYVHSVGMDTVIEEVLYLLDPTKPTYITLDIDVLDPAFAPGTGTPEIGGLSTWQLLQFFNNNVLLDYNFIGMDVVEVSPQYDVSEITSLAAATFVQKFMCMLARKNNAER